MPKADVSPQVRAMLNERRVSLWDAFHYQDHRSTTKNPTKRDPVTVVLKIPESPDDSFHGYGDTLDEALTSAFLLPHNRKLLDREGGLAAALAALQAEIDALRYMLLVRNYRNRHPDIAEAGRQWLDDLDDDVPF